MEKVVQNIPFLRLAVSLALGIYIGSVLPDYTTSLAFSTLIVFALITLILSRKYTFRLQTAFGLALNFFFLFVGIYIFETYNKKPVFYENGYFVATVLETPKEKTNSFETIADVNSFIRDDSIFETNEQIIVYFSKGNDLSGLKSGSILLFKTNPQRIENFGNPYEFDYKRYLERKKIYRQVYLDEKSWVNTKNTQNSLFVLAEKTRQKLLNIYQKLPIDQKEQEILSALTLGYKRDLDPETKRVFSSAGAMHVLAVSGLHVGIIFWILILLLGYIRKQKIGQIIFATVAILSLWGYAFITGLSPSVMRASAMFSIFILGEVFQRKSNVYNSLAASAFFLLLLNPNNIFEAGFQLSYSAVFGIVFLQPKIGSIINVRNKILKFFWDLFTVSVAAQIATLPLTLFYFGQFPIYFWITNIFIIPAVMVLIPLGILLLLISGIPFLANIVAAIVNVIIKSVFFSLYHIEELPYSVLHVTVSQIQLLIIITITLVFFILLKSRRTFYLHLILSGVLLLMITYFYQNIRDLNKNEIIVYNDSKNATLQLIHNKTTFIISENVIKPDNQILKTIARTSQSRKLKQPLFYSLKDTVVSNWLFMENRIIFFEGKTILFENHPSQFVKFTSVDLIINPAKNSSIISDIKHAELIITNKRFIPNDINDKLSVQNTTFKSAYRKIW